jgi:aspartyl-tRNA(Asn)/glutamyl-tRNA(Gln) amidotransferase subunit A
MTTLPDGAVEIAAAVRAGEVSAREVVAATYERIAAGDGVVNAFLHLSTDAAFAKADDVDAQVARGEDPGPLAGVPVGIKDALCTEGAPTTCASRILDGWVPPYTATAVRRLTGAGAVVVGKTNMDEFAMGSSCENSAFGPTRNPHDTTRVPGGSSGGSAAAVAAGFVPVTLGSDTGGSIRQPAALCGLVGMKPTYGRVSRYGLVAFASSLDQIGPMTRTVRDAAATFAVIAGGDPNDATCIPQPAPPVTAAVGDGVGALAGLRVGVVRELFELDGVTAAVRDACLRALDAAASAGAQLVDVEMPTFRYALAAYYLLAPAEASSNLARFDGVRYGLRVEGDTVEETNRLTRAAGFGPEVKRRVLLGTFALSAGYFDAYYGQAQRVRTLVIRDFDAAYERCDILCSPTSPTTAFALGDRLDDPMAMYASDVCTIPANLAGHPALSIWCGDDDAGLPIGLQLMAPALAEESLLRSAAGFEALLGTRAPSEVRA